MRENNGKQMVLPQYWVLCGFYAVALAVSTGYKLNHRTCRIRELPWHRALTVGE